MREPVTIMGTINMQVKLHGRRAPMSRIIVFIPIYKRPVIDQKEPAELAKSSLDGGK